MLRWCQSTVRALDACGTSTSTSTTIYASRRFHSAATARSRHAFENQRTRRTNTHTKTKTPSASGSVTRTMDAPMTVLPSPILRRIAGTSTQTTYAANSTTGSLEGVTPLALTSPAVTQRPDINLADTDPAAVLAIFLSPQSISPQSLHTHILTLSVDTLKTLYASAKAANHLRRLSPKDLTELIALMGTLSLPGPRNPCIYFSKLTSQVTSANIDATVAHWAFVLEVTRDKEKILGQELNGTDRYWLMRAQLAKVVLTEGEAPIDDEDPRLRAFSRATQQYFRIWRHTPDPEVHLPYLQALLDLRSPEHIATLIQRLCKVLELHRNPHSRLLDLLWTIISRHAHDLTPALKGRILTMVSSRLAHFPLSSTSPPFHPPRPSSKPTRATPSPTELGSILGLALFPSYLATTRVPSRLELHEWANREAQRAFACSIALETRWNNLRLLAISRVPETRAVSVSARDQDNVTEAIGTNATDWRPVMALAALEQTLGGSGSGSATRTVEGEAAAAARESIRGIVRPLWRAWKDLDTKDARPVEVSRAIVATFFRLAAVVIDGPLTDGCRRYCVEQGLFDRATGAEEKAQVTELLAAYVQATAVSQGNAWQDVFVASVPPESRTQVLEALLWHSRDASDGAYGVYLFAKDQGFTLSDGAIHEMSLSLASSRTWHLAVPFLDRANMSRERTEELLVAILRVFQLECREFVDPSLVKVLGNTLWQLYAHRVPEDCVKYPLRFFFPIMIASGHPARAISLVEAIHRQSPTFFTTRFALRLMRTLVRFRHLHLTPRVFRLAPDTSTRAVDDLRRKTTLYLARSGASTMARTAHRFGFRPNRWQTTRETMVRAAAFRVRSPSAQNALASVSLLARRPTHYPTIKYAATLLVRARRFYAARKVLERARPHLDRKTSTAIGNTIIHGYLKQHRLRNGRLVRQTLHTKDLLEKRYGFAPDRVTINVIIKAILRWRHAVDAGKVKALFDHMVRCGYPAEGKWRGTAGVPFDTPLAAHPFSVPAMEEEILFERHVRPLYKMFVKALFARQDVRAARTVLGIMKEEEVAAMSRREDRNRARKLGLVKKKRGLKELSNSRHS